MIKIIFFDIDGTLLPLGVKELSKKNSYALKELNKQNILVCFASGRGKKSMPIFKDIKVDVYCSFNGAYCYTSNKLIYKEPLLKEDINVVINNANKLNRFISMDNIEHIYANGMDQDLITYFSFGHETYIKVDNFNQIIKDDIYKIMLSCSMAEREIILKDTKNCKIAAWWDKAIDIVNSDSGKGEGVKRILDFYKINKDEAIAFGDGANDVEMFNYVSSSVAMGNALDNVKKKATDVCEAVENDGVYHFLVRKGIIKPID